MELYAKQHNKLYRIPSLPDSETCVMHKEVSDINAIQHKKHQQTFYHPTSWQWKLLQQELDQLQDTVIEYAVGSFYSGCILHIATPCTLYVLVSTEHVVQLHDTIIRCVLDSDDVITVADDIIPYKYTFTGYFPRYTSLRAFARLYNGAVNHALRKRT